MLPMGSSLAHQQAPQNTQRSKWLSASCSDLYDSINQHAIWKRKCSFFISFKQLGPLGRKKRSRGIIPAWQRKLEPCYSASVTSQVGDWPATTQIGAPSGVFFFGGGCPRVFHCNNGGSATQCPFMVWSICSWCPLVSCRGRLKPGDCSGTKRERGRTFHTRGGAQAGMNKMGRCT